jgi:Fe2+ transport system protein FeoA
MTMLTDNATLPLAQLPKGVAARVESCQTCDCQRHLLGLGIEPDATVNICRTGDPCIVRVEHPSGGSCRIGLRRSISEQILVRPLDD